MKIHRVEPADPQDLSRAVESDVARITPDLYIGTAPRSATDLALLKDATGITAVLSLQTPRDLDALGLRREEVEGWARALGLVWRNIPVEDFSPEALIERLDEAVAELTRLFQSGHRVYLHCTAGVSRSPSVALAYLHWVLGEPFEGALATIRQRRPQTDPYAQVLAAIRRRRPAREHRTGR
ncbi:MAG: dual specificity protein phosphatase family protein [Armatimonadota bacterium]|nr:dual specificity protein phosphatase family protein [Armatimonadota bacterium]MDR7449528.1 dual specificity protein phosphatase family protein [Armatimonadota bacterium]MDR7460713.1 dual specificity protein phosphatase family protein [Armatimonadota bacterium]MDR7479704.1 dual specificity protein phosphatase family protein [Armatimonadota bacterium]MDR7490873.1 dual specificity protein phosphatase family protein [Armatimonadota bacterium]